MASSLSEIRSGRELQPANHCGSLLALDNQNMEENLSTLQRETADYIAELTQSLAQMARRNKLGTLTALLNLIASEADSVGKNGIAA